MMSYRWGPALRKRVPRCSPAEAILSWATVEAAERVFWHEIAAESETRGSAVEIFKQYDADMEEAGRPYGYG